jgi:hypothetical protein
VLDHKSREIIDEDEVCDDSDDDSLEPRFGGLGSGSQDYESESNDNY